MVMSLIFVYGTLKRGERNCQHFLKKEEYVRDAVTKPCYRLYDNGSYPLLLEDEETGKAIQGELWRVSARTIASLDRLEGVPYLYKREYLKIMDVDEPVQGYIYQDSVELFRECSPVWRKWTEEEEE